MLTTRELDQRHAELKLERSSWEAVWRDIGEQMLPYRARWTLSERNRGNKRESKIINNTPTRAVGTSAAGLMAWVTSPARTWFGLATIDKRLSDEPEIRLYLDRVQEIFESYLARSYWYGALSNGTYPDLLAFGTSAILMEASGPGKITFRPLPIGEYCLDVDAEGKVDTCFRELTVTVRQLVQQFGPEACSPQVRDQHAQHNLGAEVVVCHAILPNGDYAPGMMGPQGKRWASYWWEQAKPEDQFLRVAGYNTFPVLAPRWSVAPGDTYGRGPGWEIRGECKALQHYERNKIRLSDLMVIPPTVSSPGIKRPSLVPGDNTVVDGTAATEYRPVFTVDPHALIEVRNCIAESEQRIKDTMFVEIFHSFPSPEDVAGKMTATEINARQEEKMLRAGPVLEGLNVGLLEPCIERLFDILDSQGLLPPAPEALAGQEIKIEFISIMHKAQQSTGLAGIRVLLEEVMAISQMRPDVVDAINADEIIEEVARITGVDPEMVVAKAERDKLRIERAKAEQAQQTGEGLAVAAEGIRDVGGVDPNNLQQLAQMFSPAVAGQQSPQG